MQYVIGIDVGSQSIKAVLVGADGSEAAVAAAPLTMSHPHSGWTEQLAESWELAITRAVHQLMAANPQAEVTAVGLACQVDGVVACNSIGEALRPAIIWLDRRAADQCDRLIAALGAERIFDVTGSVADASHSAPKMMWLRDHEPEVWEQTRMLAPVASYLLYRLTGEWAQDAANASSTMLFDVTHGVFDIDFCQVAGIDPGLLPPVSPASDVAGQLTRRAAAALGLPQTCRVVVGTGDEHGAALAAGAVRPGVVVDVTGTAEPVTVASSEPLRDATGLVETHGHAVPNTWLVENPGFVSGGSTLWLAKMLGRAQAEIFDLAPTAGTGSDGVIFLPALSGSTAPRWNDRMRGTFSGLSMNHSQAYLARAVIEGCTYALRDIVDRLDAMGLAGDEVRVVGGGSRSQFWMQIKADVMNRPVRRVLSEEATAIGAAMVAGVGAGLFTDFDHANAVAVRLAEHAIEPNADAVAIYADAYHRYRALFDGVEGALS